jgi:amidophosphoribosyltransferase
MAMGDLLAEEVRRVLEMEKIEVDVVIPVSLPSATYSTSLTRPLGARHITCSSIKPCTKTQPPLPRRICEEPIRRPNLHHAWSTNAVGGVLLLCIFRSISHSRRKNVRRKLNAMALEFSGKSVLIVDGEPTRL